MNTTPLRIDLGSEVRLHLSITLEDGTEAISTFGEEPMELRIGDGTLLQILELALIGLAAGDRESLEIDPQHAFGPRRGDLIRKVDRAQFPQDMALTPGTVVGFTNPAGEESAGIVLGIEGEAVRMDLNHPLAGHRIRYQVEILEVRPPGEDDLDEDPQE